MRQICDMPCGGFWGGRASTVAERIDAAGWGLFFLWVGVSFLLDLGWGIGLLGVGILTLGMQGVRRGFGLDYEGFWVFVGGAFMLGGLWELAAIDVSLGAVLLIGLGVVVLASALRRRSG